MNDLSSEVDYLTSIPQSLLALVDRAKKMKSFIQSAERTIKDMPELWLWLEERQIEPRFDFNSYSIDVSFTGDGPLLGEFWRIMRQAGFNTDSRPKKGDTSFSGYWRREGYASIWSHFSSSVCRQVKIGTKMVEQPIYETVCGSNLEIQEEALALPPVSSPASLESDIPF